MRFLCAAICAAFSFGAVQQSLAQSEPEAPLQIAFDILRGGGNVLVMRHANSPHDQLAPVGMSAGCVLAEGRGLDAKGLFQARALGALLRAEEVPILKAYTSDLCRAWDTAALTAGGASVVPHPAQKTTDPDTIAAFKKQIEAELKANPGQNIILSNHSNIAPLYGAKAPGNEDEVPSGAIFVVIPPNWESTIRIALDVEVSPQTVTVE